MIPKNWPEPFVYGKRTIATSLDRLMFVLWLMTGKEEDASKVCPLIENGRTHPHLSIEILPQTHPATKVRTYWGHEARGVFAKDMIPRGAFIGEYVGECSFVPSHVEIDKSKISPYAWLIGKINDFTMILDGKEYTNELAFINHYQGISRQPNLHTTWRIHRGRHYFGYQTIRKILSGEELLVNYREKAWKQNAPIPK